MYGIEHKLLALMFSGGLLLQAWIIRRWIGTYFAPAAFFPLAWGIFTIFPLVIMLEVPINALAIGFIWLSAMAFSLSALAFDWQYARRANKRKAILPINFDSSFIRRWLYLSSSLSFIFSTWTLIINGWGIDEILFDILATSGRFAAIRGNEGVEYGVIGTIGVFFTYLSPVLGGLVFSAQRTTKARIGFFIVGMAPAIYTMVTQSSKLIFLIALCFFASTSMLTNIYKGRLALGGTRHLWKVLLAVLAIFPFVLVSFLSREGYSDLSDLNDTVVLLKYAMSSYALGQVYAFADFFSFYLGMPSASVFKDDFGSMGAYTFASVFDMLGYGKDFPPGSYEETGFFPEVFETNIFTVFRGLILDFGAVGTLLFMFIVGLVANSFFYKLLVGRRPWLASTVYVATIVTILLGYLISTFMARYMYLNAIAVYAMLTINARRQQRRRVRHDDPCDVRPSRLRDSCASSVRAPLRIDA